MYKEFLSKGFYVPSHIQFDVGGLLFGAVYDASIGNQNFLKFIPGPRLLGSTEQN